MMESDDEESVRKITDFINKQKSEFETNFQEEFEHFVSYQDDAGFSSDEDSAPEIKVEIKPDEALNANANDVIIDKGIIIETDDDDLAYCSDTILTAEEKSIIDACPDPELKELLILNRKKNIQIAKVYQKVKGLLKETEETILSKKAVKADSKIIPIAKNPLIWKLGAPYFKDKRCFPSPPNEDTITKRKCNELSVYEINSAPRKWRSIECSRLITAVKTTYRLLNQKSIRNKINRIKQFIQNNDNLEETEDEEKREKIKLLEREFDEFDENEEKKIPPLNSDENIDWYRISTNYFKDKRSAEECRSMWHLLLHPSMNSSAWNNEENKRLQVSVKKHKSQNWEAIAAELNTNRSAFMVCTHYFSKLCEQFKKSKFSSEEDEVLVKLVDRFKMGNVIPWNKIAYHFKQRSRLQIYHRYQYYLSQQHVKKGKFTEAEDILILILVNKFGKNYRKCAEYMPHRSQVQLKNRFNSNLQRVLIKGTFNTEDDQLICKHVETHGEKAWPALAKTMNRYGAQLRQRYRIIKNYLRDHPDSTVEDIPKLRHRFDKTAKEQFYFLNYMAEQYKDLNFIPTISMIEEALQVQMQYRDSNPSKKKNASVKSIDTMLTDFFCSTVKLKTQKTISATNFNEASENLNQIFELLGVNLTLPQDLKAEPNLDHVDVEILSRLSKTNFESNMEKLMAPNLSNLIALRGLIIKHKSYKQDKGTDEPGTSKHLNEFDDIFEENLDEDTRTDILNHRELFCNRFDILFNWSAILSLIKPNFGEKVHAVEIVSDTPPPKKRKLDLGDFNKFESNAQPTLFDKKVVDKLVEQQKYNIIRFEPISEDIRPGSQSVKQNANKETNPPQNDKSDTEKLDSLLRRKVKVKSEIAERLDSDEDEEQLESLQHDVDLLDKILKHEQNSVESDIDSD